VARSESVTQKEQLERAAKQLVQDYEEKIRTFSVREFLKSDVDPFRFSFNVDAWGLKKAVRKEIEHKLEMALEDLFGEFHENYLGNAKHAKSGTQWEKVPKGQISGVDIANRKMKAFLQLKSKHNSMNSSSAERLAQQLEKCASNNPGSVVGCGWVVAGPKRKCIGESNVEKVGKVYKGRELFEFVTGNEKEMDEVLRDLPEILQQALKGHDFNTLLDQAAERVSNALEQQARLRSISLAEYLYQMAVK